MRKTLFTAISAAIAALLAVAAAGWQSAPAKADAKAPTQLCVVWSSGDPGVAKNVCFMYAHNAKRRGWFDTVHLVIWGPSAKLLTENEDLQHEIHAMQQSGVVVEACISCAKNYGVIDALKELEIDVKPMGEPLSDRLKGVWKVLTF